MYPIIKHQKSLMTRYLSIYIYIQPRWPRDIKPEHGGVAYYDYYSATTRIISNACLSI